MSEHASPEELALLLEEGGAANISPQLKTHIAQCARCRSMAERLAKVPALLRSTAKGDVNANFTDRVMAALSKPEQSPASKSSKSSLRWIAFELAISLVLIIALQRHWAHESTSDVWKVYLTEEHSEELISERDADLARFWFQDKG